MKTLSVSKIKGTSEGMKTRSLPKEGSGIRLLYDILFEHRGKFVPDEEVIALRDLLRSSSPGQKCNFFPTVEALRNYYGCDIVTKTIPGKGRPTSSRISLIGEWVGRVYIDYTLPASEQAAAKMPLASAGA